MANRFGSVVANALSVGARGLGYIIYGVLRVIYRRRERTIAIGVGAALLAAALLVWWLA